MMQSRNMLLSAVWIATSGLALGNRAEGTEIAVMDVAKVFEQYEMTRDLEALFDDKRRTVSAEADERRKGLDQMRRALTAFDPNSEDYDRREKDLMQAEVEFQVWSSMEEKRLKGEHKNWLSRIYENTEKVTAKIAGDRGFDLVLTYDHLVDDAPDSTSLRQQILLQKVLYHSDRIDITDEVLARLNDDYHASGGIRTLAAPAESRSPERGGGGGKPADEKKPQSAKP